MLYVVVVVVVIIVLTGSFDGWKTCLFYWRSKASTFTHTLTHTNTHTQHPRTRV